MNRQEAGRYGSPATRESAIVTGGASGIGRALAGQLAADGVRVVIADRQTELAESVASEIRASGGVATAVELDVRDADAFRDIAEATATEMGRLDYLFNNAGIAVLGEMSEYSLADWYDVLDVNLRGVIHGVAAVYPLMIEQAYGHIVNTASLGGLVPGLLSGSYIASKHAVVGLSRSLRYEAKRHGVRVSVVCPGWVDTPGLVGEGRYGRVNMTAAQLAVVRDSALSMAVDPSVFARHVLRAVRRNRAIIVAPGLARVFWYLDRLSPSLTATVTNAAFGRLRTTGLD